MVPRNIRRRHLGAGGGVGSYEMTTRNGENDAKKVKRKMLIAEAWGKMHEERAQVSQL